MLRTITSKCPAPGESACCPRALGSIGSARGHSCGQRQQRHRPRAKGLRLWEKGLCQSPFSLLMAPCTLTGQPTSSTQLTFLPGLLLPFKGFVGPLCTNLFLYDKVGCKILPSSYSLLPRCPYSSWYLPGTLLLPSTASSEQPTHTLLLCRHWLQWDGSQAPQLVDTTLEGSVVGQSCPASCHSRTFPQLVQLAWHALPASVSLCSASPRALLWRLRAPARRRVATSQNGSKKGALLEPRHKASVHSIIQSIKFTLRTFCTQLNLNTIKLDIKLMKTEPGGHVGIAKRGVKHSHLETSPTETNLFSSKHTYAPSLRRLPYSFRLEEKALIGRLYKYNQAA